MIMETRKPRRSRTIRLVVLLLGNVLFTAVLALGAFVYGWTHIARSLPELRGWHLEGPKSEFKAHDADEDYTFDHYLAQEAQVFEELQVLVEGRWTKETTGKFRRFAADSICNPEKTMTDRNWNRTFVLEAPQPAGGALLVHGLSDSPYSLRKIAQRLHKEGYTVIGLRAPGHGTCPHALTQVSWEDWVAAVRIAAVGLRERIPDKTPLVMVGFSNGGALSMAYAAAAVEDDALPRANAVVLFSPMIGITSMARITELNSVIAWASGERRAHWLDIYAPIHPYKYSSWPMNASVQAWQMTQQVETHLASLHARGRAGDLPPILALQSAVDSTVVAPQLITRLFDRLEPGAHELILFDVNRTLWAENLMDQSFEDTIAPKLKQRNLPYKLTLVTNVRPDTLKVEARTRDGRTMTIKPVGASWPQSVFSLSHNAVPFAPDDPILGTAQATADIGLPLGSLNLRGESGVLQISDKMLLRQTHNPFYKYMEDHIIEWLAATLHPAAP